MENTCAILLAAGTPQQTGGASALSQVLFRPLIRWAFDNCQGAGIKRRSAKGFRKGFLPPKRRTGRFAPKLFWQGIRIPMC